MDTYIKRPYENQNGTLQGLPFLHVAVNMIPQDFLQAQADEFIDDFSFRLAVNDYNRDPRNGTLHTNAVHDLFQAPFLKPVILIVNGVTNSPSHAPWTLLHNEGGGAADYSATLRRWMAALDSVQPPPPELTRVRRNGRGVEFAFPGQRGRTNRVECSTNLLHWSVVTNVFGTNALVTFRDTNGVAPRRYYRVRR